MTTHGLSQIVIYLVLLVALVYPLGLYMARVYGHERTFLDPILGPVERLLYRLAGVRADEEMDWKQNALAMLLFNLAGILVVYALQRLQGLLPLNPQGFGAVSPDSSFNTAVSFGTNTNWQGYGGETTMSYLTQMLGLTVQNFVSAASGMAVLALFIRGLMRHSTRLLGNFWVDMTRSTLYILLPLVVLSSPLSSCRRVSSRTSRRTRPSRSSRQPLDTGNARGHRTGAPHGSGGFANRDQAAWHERRRVLQCELGASRLRIRHRFRTSSRCSPSC